MEPLHICESVLKEPSHYVGHGTGTCDAYTSDDHSAFGTTGSSDHGEAIQLSYERIKLVIDDVTLDRFIYSVTLVKRGRTTIFSVCRKPGYCDIKRVCY
ncbi:hypothetical protein M513_04137 [Trichuris suis]|uniref:Uncharacterized protein n=1 Tax=Trichuris suis TaxID=68888 RepID=A0A085MCK9_9BILA|nr:hypothetical protein M513_04137 [Trichuris suis]